MRKNNMQSFERHEISIKEHFSPKIYKNTKKEKKPKSI